MKNNYILIDFENVQPKSLSILKGHEFNVMVFVGANQTRIPFELAEALQGLGARGSYVKIEGNGPNALDFHIAFHMGRISQQDPDAYFHVISKDTGFDPLIKHLKKLKIYAQREKELAEIPLLRISNASSVDEKVAAIVDRLASMGHARPRKVQTLKNTISTQFYKKMEESELDLLVEAMGKRGLIIIDNEKVAYKPPISQV